MIDTIVLTLKEKEYMILDHDFFEPSSKGLFEYPYYRLGKRGYFSCYQNPTKSELQNGIYKPRLTATRHYKKDGSDVSLRIEFSIPKLLYGNNFDEVCDTDFDKILKKLHDILLEMGVVMRTGFNISDAQVSSIHYSKNILLNNYMTSDMIINEISRLDLNKRLDVNMRDYRNGGAIVKFHCNSYELAFYDKIKDLQQSKVSPSRAEEIDNNIQYTLFDDIKDRKPYEVFRVEIRLNQRRKISEVFNKLNVTTEITFKALFSQDISYNVLNYFWKKILDQSKLQYIGSLDLVGVCEEVKMLNPKLSISKVIQISSYLIMAKDTPQRRLRNLIDSNSNQSWYKFVRMVKDIILPTDESYKFLDEVTKSLEVKLSVRYKDVIINI